MSTFNENTEIPETFDTRGADLPPDAQPERGVPSALVGVALLYQDIILWADEPMASLLGYGVSELPGLPLGEVRATALISESQPLPFHALVQRATIARLRFTLIGARDHRTTCEAWVQTVAVPGHVSLRLVTIVDLDKTIRSQESSRLITAGQLAAGIAHNFGNLLAAIQMRAELAQLERTTAALEDLCETVLRVCPRGVETCRNLMALARPQDSEPEVLCLDDLIWEAIETTRPQLQAHAIALTLQLNSGHHRVRVSRTEMEHVFVNLLINASHAMPDGGSLVVRTFVTRANTGECLVAEFGDSGTGIAPTDLPRVFEPFFTTKGRFGEPGIVGSGLGLSVCRSIVQSYGGTISVDSVVSQGTIVRVSLPICESGSVREHRQSLEGISDPALLPKRVLIVDHRPRVGEVLAKAIERWGVAVDIVVDPTEAAAYLADMHPDLVVTHTSLLAEDAGLLPYLNCTPKLPPFVAWGDAALVETEDGQLLRCGVQWVTQEPVPFSKVPELVLRELEIPQTTETDERPCSDPSKLLLLAEDDPEVAAPLAAYLGSVGYRVIMVCSADEAIEQLETVVFQAAIIDWAMPGGGGRRVVDHIQLLPHPPVVLVVSGRIDTEAVLAINGLGSIAAYLQKPVSLSELSRVLHTKLVEH